MQIEQMPMVRIFFEKTGRAKYTAHLDLMRMLTRALRRSRLPLWYTQGFNPHLYMTFALPIALGVESRCESVDLRFTETVPYELIVQKLDAVLPPGIRALSAAAPERDPVCIAWADYEIRLLYEAAAPAQLHAKLEAFLAQPVIEVSKKSKKGEQQVDLKPHVALQEAQTLPDGLSLRLRAAAGGTMNIAPSLFLKAFYAWSDALPDGVRITRTAILCDDMQNFR